VVGFASDCRWVLLLVTVVLLFGCNEDRKISDNMSSEMPKLEQRNSGYIADPDKWRGFLSCWQAGFSHRPDRNSAIGGSILGNYELNLTARDPKEVAARRRAIGDVERRLEMRLPQSYVDFLLAYRDPGHLSREVASHKVNGLLDLSHVGYLAELDPDALRALEENPVDSAAPDYFRYGAGQDAIVRRTKYLRNAILVGRYGDAQYEIVLLYPDVRTIDGEMEAAILFHSGEYRTPSFAEMMRQLSVLETRDKSVLEFPYPQEVLKDSCAEKLPQMGVWWK
jgi:hypothetical protein